MQAGKDPSQAAPRPDTDRLARDAIERTDVALFVQGVDGRVLYANPAAARLLGDHHGLAGFARQAGGKLLAPDQDPAAMAIARATTISAQILGLPTPEDGIRWFQVSAEPINGSDSPTPIAAVCRCVDVAELLAGRERARRQIEGLTRVLDETGVAVWEADVRADRLTWSQLNYQFYGITPEQYDGTMHGWLRLIDPEDVVATQQAVTDAIAGRAELDHRYRVRTPDGTFRYLRIRGWTRRDASGHARRIQGVCIDVTASIAQTESRVSAETIEHAQRQHAQLLVRMGHDLRSPLNAMMGFAQLIERDPQPMPDVVRENARQIARAGSLLLAMLSDLLEFSRIQITPNNASPHPVDIDRVITHCVERARARAESRDVSLEFDMPTKLTALADMASVERALDEVLRFAIGRTPGAGTVRITACALDDSAAPRLAITIADGGARLSDAERIALFDAFSQSSRLGADQRDPANGLGLAIAKGLLARVDGSIEAPDVAEVSTIRITLPLPPVADVARPLASAPPAAPHAAVATRRRMRVLYIEDNRLNIAVLSSLFRQTPGFEFAFSLDGPSGVETAERILPDIVLLDINLPGMTGDEVFRRMRASARLASIPCIAVSANALPDEVARYRAMGFAEYLTKPFNLQVLLEHVRRLGSPADGS